MAEIGAFWPKNFFQVFSGEPDSLVVYLEYPGQTDWQSGSGEQAGGAGAAKADGG